ncbi:hypothetical protein, partial [Priestia megaterium]|uniref:hypothetical protein n=1 Tax=Priestia megaterium TaxID=1404 RepID=UPI003009CCDD
PSCLAEIMVVGPTCNKRYAFFKSTGLIAIIHSPFVLYFGISRNIDLSSYINRAFEKLAVKS